MLIFWRIRYLDRNERRFKDRDLFLDSDTLSAADRAAVELVVEMKSFRSQRDVLKLRHLFLEGGLGDVSEERLDSVGKTTMFSLSDYLEDETANEIKPGEIWNYLKPEQGDEPEATSLRKPVPLAEVSLSQKEVRLLGYFTRDYRELRDSAFMKEGPGTIISFGGVSTTGEPVPSFKTALSEDEVRSFVTIFRRLYMATEPANLRNAVELFGRVIGDHPYARFVSGFAAEYEEHLASTCDASPMFRATNWQFTTKRLIDVFIYTQYAHQPNEDRQRQFNECLAEVQGNLSFLTWLFLYEVWGCSIHIGNAGRAIDGWFEPYCAHHGITPDVLNSLRHDGIGFGALEKEHDRKSRLVREKVEEIEMELWKRAGRPEGGPVQFRRDAQLQLDSALRGREVS